MKKFSKWSQKVTENSNALDLEHGIFTWNDPKKIAESLKKSVLEMPESKRHVLSRRYVNVKFLHKSRK